MVVKVCVIDEAAHQQLEHVVARVLSSPSATSNVGLLVGQSCEERELVLDVLLSPPPPSSPTTRQSKPSAYSIDDAHVCHHARQVCRMLAGGLDVLGIFVVVPSTAELKTSLASVCPALLHKLYRTLAKETSHTLEPSSRLLWLYDAETRKFTQRCLDVGHQRSELKPVEVKVQPVVGGMHTISCLFTIHKEQVVREEEGKRNIGRLAWSVCEEESARLGQAHFTFNHVHRTADTPLSHLATPQLPPPPDTAANRKERKGKGKRAEVGQHFEVDIFAAYEDDDNIRHDDVGGEVAICGSVHSVAYVHHKATVEEATRAVRDDIARTLATRCTILAEDESVYEHEPAPTSRYEMPLRSFIAVPGLNMPHAYSYYDYYEMGEEEDEETSEEITSLLSQLLSSRPLSPACFTRSRERQGEAERSERGSSEVSEDEHVKGVVPPPRGLTHYLLPGGLLLGAVLAGGIAYIYRVWA